VVKDDRTETVIEAAQRHVRLRFGLKCGIDIVPLAAMNEEDAILVRDDANEGIAGQAIRWVVFACCSECGELSPLLMPSALGDGPHVKDIAQHHPADTAATMRWQPLLEAPDCPWPCVDVAARKAYEVLARWAPAILQQHACAAIEANDLSGLWSRDASRSTGVFDALMARGLSPERATAEANKPYLQRWRRADEMGSWEVTTFATASAAATAYRRRWTSGHHDGQDRDGLVDRTIIYPLGDWVERFVGSSVLHGDVKAYGQTEGELVRRTAWTRVPPVAAVDGGVPHYVAEAARVESSAHLHLAEAQWAHTTWTSRTDHTGEVVARHLRACGTELVVRRTLLVTPVVTRKPGQKPPLVCEEVFVKLADA